MTYNKIKKFQNKNPVQLPILNINFRILGSSKQT